MQIKVRALKKKAASGTANPSLCFRDMIWNWTRFYYSNKKRKGELDNKDQNLVGQQDKWERE